VKPTQILGLLACLMGASSAQAHVRQRYYVPANSEGTKGREVIVHWPFATAASKISMHQFSGTLGTGATATTIDFAAAQLMAGASIQQWTGPFWGGLSPALNLELSAGLPVPTPSGCEGSADADDSGNPGQDHVNNIVFTSQRTASCSSSLTTSAGVIGLTKVLFDVSSGEIVEGDMQFDDIEFKFTTTPGNDVNVSPKQIYLRDVITHEFGHFLGLDHSSVREAAMLFAVSDGLAQTKSDDQAGLLSIYPLAEQAGSLATLRGSLTLEGAPVFGASVFVLDGRTLRVKAMEMTDVNGAFAFCALPPGPHVVYSDRYRPFGTNIHAYYSGDGKGDSIKVGTGCLNPGCEFMNRTLKPAWLGVDSVGGKALSLLSASAGTAAGFLNLRASTSGAPLPELPSDTASLTLDEPRLAELGTASLPLAGGAISTVHKWTFTAPASGSVQIRTAAFRLYSRLRLSLRLLDAGDADVTATACPASAWNGVTQPPDVDQVQKTSSAAYALDPWMECAVTAGQSYKVEVSGVAEACDKIPGNSPACVGDDKETASVARSLYALTVFESSALGSAAGGGTGSFEETSLAASTVTGLPTCDGYVGDVSQAETEAPPESGGCCGTVRRLASDGPFDGPRSLLLTILLSPIAWVALGYVAHRFRRRLRSVR